MNRPLVVVIDYGLGNLFSISRALHCVGAREKITSQPEEIEHASHVILPGVGAFGEGIVQLRRMDLIEPLQRYARSDRPLLGICLGMQLFMSFSDELGRHEGLNLIGGGVIAFPEGLRGKIPHTGWNDLLCPNGAVLWRGTILEGVDSGQSVYFAHSYTVVPDDADYVLGVTHYGGHNYCSVLRKGLIYGCQFHPEKSGEVGLRILRNFLSVSAIGVN